MLPSEYDLRIVEQRYHELQREANDFRLAKAAHALTTAPRGIIARLRSLAGGASTRPAMRSVRAA